MSTSGEFEICVLTPPGRGAVAVIVAAGPGRRRRAWHTTFAPSPRRPSRR